MFVYPFMVCVYVFIQSFHNGQEIKQDQFLKQSEINLNSEFSFPLYWLSNEDWNTLAALLFSYSWK